MRNKLLVIPLLFGLIAGAAQAASTDAYFDEVTGKIVMPHFKFGDETYYLTLSLTDVATLTFQADLQSITDITPPEGVGVTVNIDVEDIIGTWTLSGSSTSQFFLLFRNDGSYVHFEVDDDEGCTTGEETGTYTWQPTTGIVITTLTSDGNGECGLSHPADGVPFRIYVEGNTMQLLEKGEGIPLEEYGLVRVP